MTPRSAGRAPRVLLAVVGIGITAASLPAARAHEGHDAILSRGATVEGDLVRLTEEAQRAIGITLGDVDLATIDRTIRVRASLGAHPDRHAFASSRLAGRVVELPARLGAIVAAGDPLAVVESLELEALGEALLLAESARSFADRELARVEALARAGLAPARERVAAETEARARAIDVEASRRALLLVGLAEADLEAALADRVAPRALTVRAPQAGVLVHIDVVLGQHVEANAHLFEVLDLDEVRAVGAVPEDLTYGLHLGAPVRARFGALPGQVFETTLGRVAPRLDPAHRALPILCSLPSVGRALKPGMGGELEVVLERVVDATACPVAAVGYEQGAPVVFVEDDVGAYRRREVVLGLRADGHVEVRRGLFPGDRVVLAGRRQLAALFPLGALRPSDTGRAALGIEVEPVAWRAVEPIVGALGVVRAEQGNEAAVSARLAGRVARVLVDVGDTVARGQVLAEVESLALDRLAVALWSAHLQLALLEANRERLRSLAAEGATAPRELLEAERAYAAARLERDGLRARLASVGVEPEAVERVAAGDLTSLVLRLRAPLDGLVASRRATVGQVTEAGEALLEVIAKAPSLLELAVAEEHLARVVPGQRVRARALALPGRAIVGVVARTPHVVDVATRALPVLVALTGEVEGLRAGMRVEGAIVLDDSGPAAPSQATARALALTVPRSAIGDDAGAPFVVLVGPGGALERVGVELGRSNDRFVEVLRGLYPGDRVVVRGVHAARAALGRVR